MRRSLILMSTIEKALKEFYRSSWRDSIMSITPIIVLWYVFGYVFASPIFDETFKAYRVLGAKENALSYIALIFAIQIPLFILLLQHMGSVGYIRRHILPGVIRFRELLVSNVLLSLLLLISPRASFYYLPVLLLTLLSFYAIFESVRVLFEQRKLRKREDEFVGKLVKHVIGDSFINRITSNDFINDIEGLSRVKYSLLDISDSRKNTSSIEVRAKNGGLITFIDVSQIKATIMQRFPTVGSDKQNKTTQKEDNSLPEIILSVRPGTKIQPEDTMMRIIVQNGIKAPDEKFLNILRKSVIIKEDYVDSDDKKLDDLITDFKQQLRDAVDRDSIVSLKQSLGFYLLLLEGFTTFSAKVKGSSYTFANARQEFHQFFGDNVSKQISDISDLLNDELQHAIQTEKLDTTKEIVSFLYRELLTASRGDDILRSAFADYSMSFAVGRLIYGIEGDVQLSSFRKDIFDYLILRFREHTGLLLHNYRDEDKSNKTSSQEIQQWIEMRLKDSRDFLITSYRKSNSYVFREIISVFKEFEDDSRLYGDEVENIVLISRCSLFLIVAYIHENPPKNEEQKIAKKMISGILEKLSDFELTQILVECVDKDYADKWGVDTKDLPMDGQMHSVPSYDHVIKIIWAEYMLKKNQFHEEVQDYITVHLRTTLTFSDGQATRKKSFLTDHLNQLIEQNKPRAKELVQLVEKFIEERARWEEDTLSEALLDDDIISKFSGDVISGYEGQSIINRVFGASNKIKFVKKVTSKKYLMLGWNEIREKAAFATLKNWPVSYGLEGKNRGSEIANRQNEQITESLLKNYTEVTDFNAWLAKLKNINEALVLFHVGANIRKVRTQFEKYIDHKKPQEEIFFKNVKQLTASIQLYNDLLPSGLYAVKVSELGTVSVKLAKTGFIDISIDAYSHNKKLLDAILNKAPDWLKKHGSNKKEQTRYLNTMVRMYLYHTYLYSPVSSPTVYHLSINNDM